jgi:D-alanyl-D-alanine carboxypeptidase
LLSPSDIWQSTSRSPGLSVNRRRTAQTRDQQRIFQPLGLDDTELPAIERRIAGAHVRGYAPPDKDWQVTDGPARLVDVTEMDTSWGWAAGAMVSSTADLARFYQALLGGQLLPPELLTQMRTTVDAS